MTGARRFSLAALDAAGRAVWAGRRTRTFATLDAARTAAFELAVDAADGRVANVVRVAITEGPSQWTRRTVETLEVEAS